MPSDVRRVIRARRDASHIGDRDGSREMLRWQDSVSDRREVLPQELDYRLATAGFENCRAPGVPGEGGVAG